MLCYYSAEKVDCVYNMILEDGKRVETYSTSKGRYITNFL